MISKAQKAKRDRFIETAIKAIKETAKDQGYSNVSKETLALLFQRYKEKYNPPKLPKKIKKSKLALVE